MSLARILDPQSSLTQSILRQSDSVIYHGMVYSNPTNLTYQPPRHLKGRQNERKGQNTDLS